MPSFQLDQYFKRIHYRGQPKADIETVAELMRCQLLHVPFENLDIQAGKIVSLEIDDIVEKILTRHQGGYCYEVNGLFSLALTALNIPHILVAARPFTHGHDSHNPKTHMAIIVTLNYEKWLCDCGYGGHGIRAPMRLTATDQAFDQDGEVYMLSPHEEHELVVKFLSQDEWESLYAFDLHPQQWSDFAAANIYNSTHHDSIFVRKLLVVICTPTGRKILFGSTLRLINHGQVEKHVLTAESRALVLREHFGLNQRAE